MPLVSVVMPAFNCAAYVEEAVRSALAQTENDLELIVVDDGSTDETPGILSRLTREDSRLRLYRQPNSGKAAIARNAGIARARGHFVAFLDGDDLFHPQLLERTLAVFKRLPNVGLVFSDYAFMQGAEVEPTGNLARLRLLEIAAPYLTHVGDGVYQCDTGFYRSLSTNAFGAVSTLTAIVRRDVLRKEELWFAEDLVTYEDNDLWLRLALRTQFAYVDEVLAYYRRHGANTTSNPETMALGAIVAKTRNLERGARMFSKAEVRTCRRILSEHYFTLGYLRAKRNDKSGALSSYLAAARLHPTYAVCVAMLKALVPNKLLHTAERLLNR